MRTRAEWFSLLPDDVREKALDNLKREEPNDFIEWLQMECTSMDSALRGAFYWYKSSEGKEYWIDITREPQWKQYEEENK